MFEAGEYPKLSPVRGAARTGAPQTLNPGASGTAAAWIPDEDARIAKPQFGPPSSRRSRSGSPRPSA